MERNKKTILVIVLIGLGLAVEMKVWDPFSKKS